MDPFEMVVSIVAIVFTGSIISKYLQYRMVKLNTNQETDNAASDVRLDEIEQRLKVLEQIVTSDRYDLEQQFKNIDRN